VNEAETRAELIDPKLLQAGWGLTSESKVLREYGITLGQIQPNDRQGKPHKADYILTYRGQKLAVIEAKSDERHVGEGVAQAKHYAGMLNLMFTYSSNGKEIYRINMKTGEEGPVSQYPTPDELWSWVFSGIDDWTKRFQDISYEDIGGTKPLRYYQENAVNNTLKAIAQEKQRVLLTLATGTGKTFIAFQIAWKLFQSRWNLKRDGKRRPRILFLADRNILVSQAFNDFSSFPEDALVRISPDEIRKRGSVPKNGSVFFTIFQTFMCGPDNAPYFGDYPNDYFDLIIIDECHRGGARDESQWRAILEYFSPAVHLGLTATPKRRDNVDTYAYFGEPVYIYSLKEGINDGFLTPFKVKRIHTTLDEYMYTPDDQILEGEVEEGRLYKEPDFNRVIEIKAREAKRVKIVLDAINQNEKTIIFCANQEHAIAIRDLVNQMKDSTHPDYCHRVTANDGKLGDRYFADFRDNEKTIPTILTTSQKLSTGVDARNVRNIVLMRTINSMIEFKQIIGRGTRLFDGKSYFTIYDFVNAYQHFADPEWDGEPIESVDTTTGPDPEPRDTPANPSIPGDGPTPRPPKIKIKLRDGKEREIQHMISSSFWSADGKPIAAEEFLKNLYGKLPEFFKNEEELREIWSNPVTRKILLDQLDQAGFSRSDLTTLQQLIDAEKSDLFDVLEYVAYMIHPMTRQERVAVSEATIYKGLSTNQVEFLRFVLSKYIETGVEELDQEKLPKLLELKYHSVSDGMTELGDVAKIKNLFLSFQRYLYQDRGKVA
jgi:type I restriction enzyme R subunit